MSGLDDISNLNESLTQGGKYTSNKSDLLGSFTELQENANEVIHSTIEQFLPGHFDAVDDGTGNDNDVAFQNTTSTDISLNVLIDNFKDLAGQFNTALQELKDDSGYGVFSGDSPSYDLSFGYVTASELGTVSNGPLSSDLTTDSVYFVSRVDGTGQNSASDAQSNFQFSELINDATSTPTVPSGFTETDAPEHLRLTCGNLPELKASDSFFTAVYTPESAVWTKDGNGTTDNTASTGDNLAIENQTKDDIFGDNLTRLDNADLLAARKRMCNPYNIIEDQDSTYNSGNGGKAGQKFAKVTYLATQITALVKEMNRRIIDEGAKITDADGNEIALTLAQLNEKYDTLLAENANVDANLETESLKFDSENLIYIGMLVATVTAMAVGFTSLAKKTDMS